MQRPFVLSTKLFVAFCFLAACTGDAGPQGTSGSGGRGGTSGTSGAIGGPGNPELHGCTE